MLSSCAASARVACQHDAVQQHRLDHGVTDIDTAGLIKPKQHERDSSNTTRLYVWFLVELI
jgi:hypothetical protein